MSDITAKYGTDYTVKLYKSGVLEGFIHNRFDSESMIDVIDSDDAVEFNYSDALVTGQLAEEEELTDADTDASIAIAEDILDDITTAPIESSSADELDTAIAEATTLSEEEIEVITEADTSTLGSAYENATGLSSDRAPMQSTDTELFAGVDRTMFMDDEVAQLNEGLNSAYFIANFAPGETEKFIEITPIDNALAQGDKLTLLNIFGEDDTPICNVYSKCSINIIDDEHYDGDKLYFSQPTYYPNEGYATVEVVREGSCLDVISAKLDTYTLNAVPSRDYSEVHTDIDFLPGLKKRTVKIPIVSTYLEEEASFGVMLSTPANCLLGEQDTATVTIEKGAHSIDVSTLGADMTLGSKMYGDPIPFSRFKGSRGGQANSSSYSRQDGNSWRMYTEDGSFSGGNAYTFTDISLGNTYAYSGFKIVWRRESGKPCYGSTWVNVDRATLRDTSNERWDTCTDEYFMPRDKVVANNLNFELKRSKGMWGKSPTLVIDSVTPILRPFEVTLAQADPVKLRDENGNLVDNTTLSNYSSKNRCLLENATNTSTGSTILVAGYDATVRLYDTESPVAYIKGIDLINPKTKQSVRVVDNLPVGTTSATFRLTEDNINRYNQYFDFVQNGNMNMYGRLMLRPILANIPATIVVKNDSRVNISLPYYCDEVTSPGGFDNTLSFKLTDFVSNYKNRTTSNQLLMSGNDARYRVNIGDYVRYDISMTDDYAGTYTWDELRIKPTSPSLGQYGVVRSGENSYVGECAKYSAIEVSPNIVKNDNALVVRVHKDDIDKFNKNYGIFKYPSKKIGNYYNYTIATKANLVVDNTYEMLAVTNDTALLSAWTPAFDNRTFTQNYFFHTASGDTDRNVIYLSTQNPADQYDYSVSGKFLYDDVAIGTNISIGSWNPVPNVLVMVDASHFGASGPDGAFNTYPISGNGYLRFKYSVGGKQFLCDVALSTDKSNVVSGDFDVLVDGKPTTVTKSYHKLDLGNITISNQNQNAPRVSSVICTNGNGVATSTIVIDDQSVVSFMANIDNDGTKYIDTDGVERSEEVQAVDFVVYDGVTHKQKHVFEGATKLTGTSMWSFTTVLSLTEREKYQASDLLYCRIKTNRYVGNGKGKDENGNPIEVDALKETTYAPIRTTYTFSETNPQAPVIYEFDPMPEGGFYQLPMIGSLNLNITAAGFNFGMETIPNGKRLQFGKAFSHGNQHKKDSEGDDYTTSDSGTKYDTDNFKSGFSDMTDKINLLGKDIKKLGKSVLGVPMWEVSPFVGMYLDFHLTYTAGQGSGFTFSGGGGYFGINGMFRYAYYMVIWGVPVYVGASINGTALAEIGFKRKPNVDVTMQDFLKSSTKFRDDIDFDFTFRASVTGQIFAGVGICGTLGARGGFQVTFNYIWQPTIQEFYPTVSKTGYRVTASVGLWIDALFFTIPIQYTLFDKPSGYFKDVEELDKKGGVAVTESASPSNPTPTLKPRSATESIWLGDATPSKNDLGIVENLTSTFSPTSVTTLLQGGYDSPDQKLVSYDYGKQLLVYLDDDKARPDSERTALMYTVFDGTSWSTPVVIQQDGTFDAMPYLCDAGEDIIIAWISHEEGTTLNHQVDYLKATNIYVTRFNKATATIGDITQLTDDDMYNANPQVVYDRDTGDVIVIYSKSEVDSTELMDEYLPTNNGAQLVYMLYDASRGDWARDYFYDNEVAPTADRDALITNFKGQRFIASPISDFNMTNPPIIDLSASNILLYQVPDDFDINKEYTAAECDNIEDYIYAHCSNNAVIAYTVDEDNNLNTVADRELFIQIYNFALHKFGAPIRICKDNVSDSVPQLLYDKCDNTTLFYVEDDKNISYIDIGAALFGKVDEDNVYDNTASFVPGRVSPAGLVDDNGDTNIASYRAIADYEGNIYVNWTEPIGDSKEVFTSALVYKVGDGEYSYSWSAPAQVTYSDNRINDLPVAGFDAQNNLLLIHNSYKVDFADETLAVKDTQLTLTNYEIVGSLYLTDCDAVWNRESNTVDAKLTLTNTGLRNAYSFTASGYLTKDGVKVTGTDFSDSATNYDNPNYVITAGATHQFNVTFNLPDGSAPSDYTVHLESTETFADTPVVSDVALFSSEVSLDINNVEVTQCLDYFILTCDITNTGVVESPSTNTISVVTNNMYNESNLPFVTYASDSLPTIPAGETKTIYLLLDVPANTLDRGFANIKVSISDESTNTVAEADSAIALSSPYGFVLLEATQGDGALIPELVLNAGSSITLHGTYDGDGYFKDGALIYTTDDTAIATVTGNVLNGIAEGTTYLIMTTDPFGGAGFVKVTVQPKKRGGSKGLSGGTSGASSSTSASSNTGASDSESLTLDDIVAYLISPFTLKDRPTTHALIRGMLDIK